MKLIRKAAVGALVVASTLAFAGENPAPPAQDATAATATADANASAVVAGPDYVIGPEDVLNINVWKEADLTATLPVRPDGKISLPLLADVQASGLTPVQLSESITEKLKKFVADPRVTVVVTAINSKRVYLVGEVARSGAMPMLPNMTVLQALSAAGIGQFANTKRIYVLRSRNGKQEKLPVDYRKLVKGEGMDRNYTLVPGDTIVVP